VGCGLNKYGQLHGRLDTGKGRNVAPLWPRLTARLQRSAGGRLVSVRSWSTHLLRGCPGRRRALMV